MLLFTSKEAPLDTARYRITRYQSSLGGDWPDVRHSYIKITRYNLAPALHRDNVAAYGEPAAPAGPAVEVPHVSWRLVTTGLMGQRAPVVDARRPVVAQDEAASAPCLDGLSSRALCGFAHGGVSDTAALRAPAQGHH